MMANYLASNDFTFVHPSGGSHLVGAPSTSVGYNLDFHGPQSIFSPINCTMPTTIQFPTPPVTSLPQNGSGLGSCLAEAANGMASAYNFACVTWQPPVNLNPPQALLSTCTDVSLPFVSNVSATPMPNGGFGTTSLWSHKLSNCAPPQVGGCKRKAEALPEDCWLPTKVRINEERMSACMSHLHLDNNNSGAQPNLESEPWYSQDIKTDASVAELEELESFDFAPDSSAGGGSLVDVNGKLTLNKNSKLELCRELELGMKTKEILPKVILDELVKSSMQVVLWRPPEHFGQHLLTELSDETCKPEADENLIVDEYEMAGELSASNLPTLRSSQDLMTCQPWAVPLETSSLATDLLDDYEDMDL